MKAVNGPLVSRQRARLSKILSAHLALERLQVNVALVVDDKTCALRGRPVADCAVWLEEHALKMSLASFCVLCRNLKLPVGAVG